MLTKPAAAALYAEVAAARSSYADVCPTEAVKPAYAGAPNEYG